jgi:hypothetical protein
MQTSCSGATRRVPHSSLWLEWDVDIYSKPGRGGTTHLRGLSGKRFPLC